MCIIIVPDIGIKVPEEHLENSYLHNKDGFGLMWHADEGPVRTFKTLDFEEFKKKYDEVFKEFPKSRIILHLRNTTAGETNIKNCHPFVINNGEYALMHNGTITSLTKFGDEESDSSKLAKLIDELPEDWFENQSIHFLLENLIDFSRVAILARDGRALLLNSHKWEKHGGIEYSSDYWRGTVKQFRNPYGYWSGYEWEKNSHAYSRGKERKAHKPPKKYRKQYAVWWDNLINFYAIAIGTATFVWVHYFNEWRKYDFKADWYTSETLEDFLKKKETTMYTCEDCGGTTQYKAYDNTSGYVGAICKQCADEYSKVGWALKLVNT